jgi:hypothetical protein
MYKFNKLEKLLDLIVEGKKADDGEPNLTFDLGEHLLIFSRDDDSAMCYLDCVSHNSYDKKMARYNEKFEFELPLIHIHHFMMKYIDDSKKYNHFLLTYPPSTHTEDLDEIYNNLIEKINITPEFFPTFLPGVLNKELPVNAESTTKKLKI